jgi:DNA-binding PadR family transcriptional regulator
MTGQPSLWDQTGGKVGHHHPQTSHTAARQVRSGSQQALILLALWDGPSTAYRLSTGGRVVNKGGYPVAPNQIATRLGELRDRGWVVYARQFPGGPIVEETTTPGNSGQVQKLTDLGRSEAIRLRHAR